MCGQTKQHCGDLQELGRFSATGLTGFRFSCNPVVISAGSFFLLKESTGAQNPDYSVAC